MSLTASHRRICSLSRRPPSKGLAAIFGLDVGPGTVVTVRRRRFKTEISIKVAAVVRLGGRTE